jgi:hypothetical protein
MRPGISWLADRLLAPRELLWCVGLVSLFSWNNLLCIALFTSICVKVTALLIIILSYQMTFRFYFDFQQVAYLYVPPPILHHELGVYRNFQFKQYQWCFVWTCTTRITVTPFKVSMFVKSCHWPFKIIHCSEKLAKRNMGLCEMFLYDT